MFAQHQPLQCAPAEANREQQRQFAAPLQHVSHHYHSESDAAEQQTQSAQNLEGGQIGVLHGVEGGQTLRRRCQFHARVMQRARESFGNFIRILPRRVD